MSGGILAARKARRCFFESVASSFEFQQVVAMHEHTSNSPSATLAIEKNSSALGIADNPIRLISKGVYNFYRNFQDGGNHQFQRRHFESEAQ